jgi:phosphoserine phosphatase RsbU/P
MNIEAGEKNLPYTSTHEQFIEYIINGMYDWVRVLDRDDNIIYINKAMSKGLKRYAVGEKCYAAVGREKPCENCIARKAVFDGASHEKEEYIGDRIFSVLSSPVKDVNGEVIAVVEVLRDITQMKALQRKILEQYQKIQNDLNMAKRLQCSLLPQKVPDGKIKFSFLYKPCETLGGDFVDIFKVDDDHVGVYIADVSGHGVPASMLLVFLRSTINKKVLSPSEAMKDLYERFMDNYHDQEMYITVFYAVVDTKKMVMKYCNAGHNIAPILFNKEKFEILRMAGTPICNWFDTVEYKDGSIQLEQGDRIFLCTDGLVELKNREKRQFGEERLLEILLNEKSDPDETLNRIVERAYEFAEIENTSEVPDDITLALLEIL